MATLWSDNPLLSVVSGPIAVFEKRDTDDLRTFGLPTAQADAAQSIPGAFVPLSPPPTERQQPLQLRIAFSSTQQDAPQGFGQLRYQLFQLEYEQDVQFEWRQSAFATTGGIFGLARNAATWVAIYRANVVSGDGVEWSEVPGTSEEVVGQHETTTREKLQTITLAPGYYIIVAGISNDEAGSSVDMRLTYSVQTPEVPAKSPNAIRVAAWNINSQPVLSVQPTLRALGADVILLQEVRSPESELRTVASRIGLPSAASFYTLPSINFGLALFHRFEQLNATSTLLPITPGREPRALLVVQTDQGTFTNTHIEPGPNRDMQIAAVAAEVDSLADPLIVGGDWQTEAANAFFPGFVDTGLGGPATYRPLDARIDTLFVRGISASEAIVVATPVSDHNIVLVDVTPPSPPPPPPPPPPPAEPVEEAPTPTPITTPIQARAVFGPLLIGLGLGVAALIILSLNRHSN